MNIVQLPEDVDEVISKAALKLGKPKWHVIKQLISMPTMQQEVKDVVDDETIEKIDKLIASRQSSGSTMDTVKEMMALKMLGQVSDGGSAPAVPQPPVQQLPPPQQQPKEMDLNQMMNFMLIKEMMRPAPNQQQGLDSTTLMLLMQDRGGGNNQDILNFLQIQQQNTEAQMKRQEESNQRMLDMLLGKKEKEEYDALLAEARQNAQQALYYATHPAQQQGEQTASGIVGAAEEIRQAREALISAGAATAPQSPDERDYALNLENLRHEHVKDQAVTKAGLETLTTAVKGLDNKADRLVEVVAKESDSRQHVQNMQDPTLQQKAQEQYNQIAAEMQAAEQVQPRQPAKNQSVGYGMSDGKDDD